MKRLLHLTLIVLFVMTSSGCMLRPTSAEPSAAIEWPTITWSTSTPEEQGFDSAQLAVGLEAIRAQGLNLHSVLLVRNGKMIVDAYFYPYDGQSVHDQASVTKSIMTTLIAIAADQGKLNLDDPLLSFFPERTIANRDAAKERITVRHLVSMASGLDCTAANDEQTLHEMAQSSDFVQFTLDRKMLSEPGTQFVYCSPGMHLLSAILQEATGQTALDFAQENLFEPLGITEVIWPTDPQGYNHGWGDLYLHPHDTAKIGLLWLNHGEWAGQQLVPSKWVEESVKSHLKTGDDDDYGYGWWITGDEGEYAAIGRGGQRIQIWPALNMLLVMTGGGVEIDDIEPFLSPAFVDPAQPLPANPAAVADLAGTIVAVAAPPAPTVVAALPAIAQEISGKTFVFASNPLGMAQVALTFGAPTEATMQIAFGEAQPATWSIGLDGVYRLFPGKYDLPQGLRGEWTDDQTFVVEYDNIANNDHLFLRFHFAGERVTVESQETAHELSVRFEGQLRDPN
jgi:CubicO group peptidase (beta-lactamase class C family)